MARQQKEDVHRLFSARSKKSPAASKVQDLSGAIRISGVGTGVKRTSYKPSITIINNDEVCHERSWCWQWCGMDFLHLERPHYLSK
jgi:hypothetical protein